MLHNQWEGIIGKFVLEGSRRNKSAENKYVASHFVPEPKDNVSIDTLRTEVWEDKSYDFKSDIWSLGVCSYEMTTLKPPFTATSMNDLYTKVLSGKYPKIPSEYSRDLSSIISTLLKVKPSERPSCEQILHMPSVEEH